MWYTYTVNASQQTTEIYACQLNILVHIWAKYVFLLAAFIHITLSRYIVHSCLDPKESQTAKMSGEKTPTPASDIKQKVSEPDETPASVSERVPNQSTLNPGIQSQPVVPPKTTVTTTAPIKPEIIGSLDMISQGPPPNQVAPFSASFPGHSSMQQISKPSIGPIPSATVSPAVSMPSVTPKVSVPVQPSLSQQMTQNLSFPGPRVSTPATNPVHPSMEVSAAVPQMPVQQTPFPHITVCACLQL
jgi:hypothetical protein